MTLTSLRSPDLLWGGEFSSLPCPEVLAGDLGVGPPCGQGHREVRGGGGRVHEGDSGWPAEERSGEC